MTTEMYDDDTDEVNTMTAETATSMNSILQTALRYILIYIFSILAICYGYLVLHTSAQILLMPSIFLVSAVGLPPSVGATLTACNILVLVQAVFIGNVLRHHMLTPGTCAVLAGVLLGIIFLLAIVAAVGEILAV